MDWVIYEPFKRTPNLKAADKRLKVCSLQVTTTVSSLGRSKGSKTMGVTATSRCKTTVRAAYRGSSFSISPLLLQGSGPDRDAFREGT